MAFQLRNPKNFEMEVTRVDVGSRKLHISLCGSLGSSAADLLQYLPSELKRPLTIRVSVFHSRIRGSAFPQTQDIMEDRESSDIGALWEEALDKYVSEVLDYQRLERGARERNPTVLTFPPRWKKCRQTAVHNRQELSHHPRRRTECCKCCQCGKTPFLFPHDFLRLIY
jgi:hypothetical protein